MTRPGTCRNRLLRSTGAGNCARRHRHGRDSSPARSHGATAAPQTPPCSATSAAQQPAGLAAACSSTRHTGSCPHANPSTNRHDARPGGGANSASNTSLLSSEPSDLHHSIDTFYLALGRPVKGSAFPTHTQFFYIGEAPRDVAKIEECLQRLSQLVIDFKEIDELDMNPLLVYEEGKGALVLDARFLLK